ncbi:MAG: hypothetical protein VR72_06345 [Clostridiaceae bacterium BRH_c20a]|nr:MAG: hypothetical protein VR72_06345 [Clostridiaceae bacterium BRH_c20a]
MKVLGNCNITGIGSLPLNDVSASHNLIKETFPLIPHWPQLPKLGESEGFINQYLTPLIDIGLVRVVEGKTPYFDTTRADFTDLLTEFYSLYLEAVEGNEAALARFGFADGSAKGFYSFTQRVQDSFYAEAEIIKGQVSGPLTLGLQVTDSNKKASFYDDQLRDVLTKTLALAGKWQSKKLLELGLPVIIFIDDPGLYSLGSSTYITLTKEGIINELNQVIEAINSTGALAGSHTCAGTEWPLLFSLDLAVVNFDAYEYFSSMSVYIKEINEYLAKGGILSFGIVPTSEKLLQETTASLVALFEQQVDILEQKGVNREKLLQQVLITPSCGTGSLSEELATLVYKTIVEVSKAIKEKYNL